MRGVVVDLCGTRVRVCVVVLRVLVVKVAAVVLDNDSGAVVVVSELGAGVVELRPCEAP